MQVLKAENILKTYNKKLTDASLNVINGLNMTISEGEFTAIMGSSGSGKTTLLNIFSGIDKPTLGNIEINGINISNLDIDEKAIFRRENLGIISQGFSLLSDLTLYENIALPLIMLGKSKKKVKEKAEELVKLLNIYDVMDEYPTSVSQGQRQRAACCRALITNPKIILADEPTGNLDSKSAKKFMNYLKLINDEKKVTLLLATHDSKIASYCTRVIFLKDGVIFADIYKNVDDRKFLNKILDCLAIMGGDD